MASFIGLWIFFLIVVLVLIALYKTITFFSNKLYPDEPPPYPVLSPISVPTSISREYEEVLENPTEYPEEERGRRVSQYRKLLYGEIQDPKCLHAPRERVGEHLNQDYLKYLEHQNSSWHRGELKRVTRVYKEETVKTEFVNKIFNMGCPGYLVHAACSDHRMETLRPDQWKDLIRTLKSYDRQYENGHVLFFMDTFKDDLETILNPDCMEVFDMLMKHDVELPIAKLIIDSDLHEDTITEILLRVDNGENSHSAINHVLTEEREALEAELERKRMREAAK